ncbi:hypothetical protein FACS189449_13020 [Alphaproteobacteria bacterium]|nr:hypothetical protein FACS189449_13020 [Alphaproteobacteria bacterium]
MLKDLILSEKTKGTIAIIAAVVMYFTPDYIDAIIEAGLAAVGISKLVIKKSEHPEHTFAHPFSSSKDSEILSQKSPHTTSRKKLR